MKRLIPGMLLLACLAGAAHAQTVDPGWEAFIIRAATADPADLPIIQNDDTYVTGALEFIITEGGQKAGLGTDQINGAKVSQIATLHIDRLDDVVNSGSLYGPYFNIWVTDGAGHYAVIANEPSNPEWGSERWDVASWDDLRTKTCKVYETPGAAAGTSWVHAFAGTTTLTFEDIGDLVIMPPPPAYIADPANEVGSGAPDELGTDIARGYNWIFGDTLANYVSGDPGFIVANYSVSAPLPVTNVTQGTAYGTIQAALDAAAAGDAITIAAGHYEEQLHITVDDLTVTGAGVDATFVDSPGSLALSYTTSADNYPVVFVDNCTGLSLSNLTVDGLGRGNANYRFQGIGFWNAGGAVSDARVANVTDTPFSGAQHCVGIYAYNTTGGPYTIDVTDVLVDGYQKGGIAVNGAGATANFTRVTTHGAGATDVTAQNGLQIGFGAAGTVTECDVADHTYTGGGWWAGGVLVYDAGPVVVTGTDIDSSQGAVSFTYASGSVTGGSITNATGAAVGVYAAAAKGAPRHGLPSPLVEDYRSAAKAAETCVIDGVAMTGDGSAGTLGLEVWADGTIELQLTNSSLGNFGTALYLEEAAGAITGGAAGNTIAGNLDLGAWSNTATPFDARGNDWGDASGPYAAARNPLGLGDAVEGSLLFTPWTGRTTAVVADLDATPTGAYFWEGTPALGVDDDNAPGFAPGCFAAAGDWVKYGLDPEAVFGRPVNVGELHSISYFTKKGTLHTVDAGDWYFQMYTDPYDGSPGSTWYGHRINSEPYFSENLTETAGAWNQWQTDAGQPNRLRFFDSSSGYLGSYSDGFLADLATDPVLAPQPIMIMDLGLGTAWGAGFDGRLDGLVVELVSGETMRLDFVSGNAAGTIAPADAGPLPCGAATTADVAIELSGDMPDVFLYNAVVRASAGLDIVGATDLLPFGTTNNTFYHMDNGDGSWTVTGSTVGSPTSPVVGPAVAGLFRLDLATVAEGAGTITFDSLVLRDPDNQPIAVVTDGATVTVDCTAPAAVTGITAAPGHNKIDVAWTHDGTDVDHYEVFAGLWHDGSGASAYPEYDDLPADVIPARPATPAAAAASSAWEALPPVSGATALTQGWPDHLSRGVYYYEVFAVDAAGNAGPAAAANDRATSYWLGDVTGTAGSTDPDGVVNVSDINDLGTHFFETVTTATAALDVGPTDDWSRTGIPLTDNVLDFEDLAVFAMNFGVVSAAKGEAPLGDSVELAWVDYGEGRYGLRLEDGPALKALHVSGGAAVTAVEAGALLDRQGEPTFLRNGGGTLNAVVAVMGVDVGFTGTGDLMVVHAADAVDLADLVIDARATDNSKLEVSLEKTTDSLTPRVFALYGNYPNPFNPVTKISFSLPDAQPVRLSIYTVDGRRVATLVDEVRGPGLHEVLWSGADDAGRRAASGVYFYRLDAGPHTQVRKMTLVK